MTTNYEGTGWKDALPQEREKKKTCNYYPEEREKCELKKSDFYICS